MPITDGPLMAAIAFDSPAPRDQRRASRRILQLEVAAVSERDSTRALIHDLSEAGLLLETSADLRVGEMLHVDLPEAGAVRALVVWSRGRLFGCEFMTPVPKAAVSAALLRSPRAAPGEAAGPDSPVPSERDPDHMVERAGAPRRGLALAAAALAGGIALVAATAGPTAALITGGVFAVSAGLLIAWGVWIENNIRF